MGQAKNRGNFKQRQQTATPKQTKAPTNKGELSMTQATTILLRAGRSIKRR